MKFLIITTILQDLEKHIWKMAETNENWKEENDTLICKVSNDKLALMFKQIDASGDDEEDLTKECVDAVKNFIGMQTSKSTYYIAAHGEAVAPLSNLKLSAEKGEIVTHSFTHLHLDETYSVLKTFVQNPNENNFTSACKEVEKKNEIAFAFWFGHKLARVMTPVLVDFQGLKETDFNEEYWAEILEDYQRRKTSVFDTIADLIKNSEEKINSFPDSAKKKAANEVVDLLKKYRERAKALDCLTRRDNFCPTQIAECEKEHLECVKAKIESVFIWAGELQQKTSELSKT